ncbi:MAG: HepT-like ribonuclease domain-containing protein [Janthinobacterium lividum]
MNPNKNKPRDPDRARHMLEAARWINEKAAGTTLIDLLADKTLQLALERQFEILGEAAFHVSDTTQQQRQDIDWRRIKAFRNLTAHEYFRVDYAQILYTAQQIIPQLLPLLEDLVLKLDQQFGPDASV